MQLLDKAADVPVAVPPRFRGRCSCCAYRRLVCFGCGPDRGVDVFFFGVKGVGDVLAGL